MAHMALSHSPFSSRPGPSHSETHSSVAPTSGTIGHQFSPYTENGGSILAIAGSDFCVIAGDTRMSEGYNIQTRYKPKVFRLTDQATLATNGFSADAEALVLRIRQRLEWYRHAHNRSMPLHSIARMISTILYSKRFFPYYVYNILGGVDEQGKGGVYSFDPVGSYEREFCRAAGAAQSLLQPFLDSQVMFKNQHSTPTHKVPTPGTMSLPQVLSIVQDSFTSATERHIEVGDGLEMFVVRVPKTSALAAKMEAPVAGKANEVDLISQPYGAVEALGGEDGAVDGSCVVIRKELKKD